LPVLILLTNWDPPRDSNAKGYWHRNGLVQYTEERLDKNTVRAISLQDALPAVGIYVQGKERDYSHLNPVFLKAYGFEYNPKISGKYTLHFRIEWRGDELSLSSKELLDLPVFKEIIRSKRWKYFFLIEDNEWSKIKQELEDLGYSVPLWWDILREEYDRAPKSFEQRCIKCLDGHYVRSRAERMIDDTLYINKILHAYELRLPTEEECYCDFYLPGLDTYIEYWESIRQEDRKRKLQIYQRYGLDLIEISERELQDLDSYLKREIKKRKMHSR
jgi:hypothetical protein